ncbi:hypothetical protein CQW23_30893 [Capsicum baccatum]|uniref:NB-ARC domain-containing protein n=1 Tax=Capsicum baccatum TaxID=33114 RepID=A0A2G2V972_CAPBA|nr:hypothetical protein CQW23_30893 [Capsicum baccatum]
MHEYSSLNHDAAVVVSFKTPIESDWINESVSEIEASNPYVVCPRTDGDLEGQVRAHRLKEGMGNASFLHFLVSGEGLILLSEERLLMFSGEALFVIQVFALWLTRHGRLRTQNVLLKWDMPINGDCVLCGSKLVVLNCCNEEQQGSSNLVRDWIKRLKKVFFEADDLLDAAATEVKHRKLFNKAGIFFSKSNPMIYNCKISHRLKSIRRDLELIAKDKASLDLVERREPFLPETYSVQFNLDRETYSFVPEGEVIGRNDDKKKIMNFLLDSKVEENVVVISIVGLGGLGKTALAQCVFNDEMV